MRYASLYAANLAIGSGATEGTGGLLRLRVKRRGQSWEPFGLRGILTIRSLVLSGRWDTVWNAFAAIASRGGPLRGVIAAIRSASTRRPGARLQRLQSSGTTSGNAYWNVPPPKSKRLTGVGGSAARKSMSENERLKYE